MTSTRADNGKRGHRDAACACGQAFPGPWELVAHLLDAYPPGLGEPRDGEQHADATRLAVKLDTGPSGAWEVVTWAGDRRKDLRVAAAITYRAKTGDLRPWQKILRRQIRDTYQVSTHVASAALGILQDFGIAASYGGRNCLTSDNIEATLSRHHTGTMLDLIARHVARMEDELSALNADPGKIKST